MPIGIIGRISNAPQLREALDTSAQRVRAIADRVSKASMGGDGFALPAVQQAPGSPETGGVDLETEMTSLADEQLRFEATAKLLAQSYQQIRASLRDR